MLPADWSAASGTGSGSMLARIPEVTAVFAANDHLALGLLRALHEHGRRVPHDVSIVGFDDVPEAGYFIPPLTTVRPDFHAVAARALRLLLRQIESGEHPSASTTWHPRWCSAAASVRRRAEFPLVGRRTVVRPNA